MKRLVAAVALSAALASPAAADPFKRAMRPDVMAPADIAARMTSAGYSAVGTPVRRGDYYEFDASNAQGVKMRILADALFGEVVSVTPSQTTPQSWDKGGGPRIIHVPLPSERPQAKAEKPAAQAALAATSIVTKPVVAKDIVVKDVAVKIDSKPAPLPPRRRPFAATDEPRPVEAAPPALPKRAVLSAPPLFVEGPSPVRPLPRWRETNDTRPVEAANSPSATIDAELK